MSVKEKKTHRRDESTACVFGHGGVGGRQRAKETETCRRREERQKMGEWNVA